MSEEKKKPQGEEAEFTRPIAGPQPNVRDCGECPGCDGNSGCPKDGAGCCDKKQGCCAGGGSCPLKDPDTSIEDEGVLGAAKSGFNGFCDTGSMRGKLHSFNYLDDIPGGYADDLMVEVQFKNTRKGFYLNSQHIPLEIGDWVAVEASPGHDIGRVTLTGALVKLQMRKAGVKPDAEQRRVFRKARPNDMERYEAARSREHDTMIRSRKIASSLQLNMKIGDVEYQGDGNKAIFYYIADERVDFRQLIKVLAETFKVRIEMKQIGARQEAGRIGGIGPCGRPLCCTTWMGNFSSVSTSAARYQDISLNPQKLAGQCAKLKCCLNFEIDTYMEASKKLPPKDAVLETADGNFYYFKADIFKREVTYSTDKGMPANLVTISAQRAFEVIALNKNGEKPLKLATEEKEAEKKTGYVDLVGQDSLTRFDSAKKKKKKSKGQQGDPKKSENKDPKASRPGEAKDKKPQQGQKPQGQQPKQGGKPQQGQPKSQQQGQKAQQKPQSAPRQGQKPQPKQPQPQGQKPQQSQDQQAKSRQGQKPRPEGQQPNNRGPRPDNTSRQGSNVPANKPGAENAAPARNPGSQNAE